MKIVNLFKEKIDKLILKRKLLLPVRDYNYVDSVKKIKEDIINSIPENLEEIEKAYYIYIELGKVLNENPINAFGTYKEREKLSDKKIEDELHGNCKAIAQLYVNILNDKRVGIKADLIAMRKKRGSHVDAILHIDGKQYITNLISDLSRIKTAKRVNSFCFDLKRNQNIMYRSNPWYEKRIEKYYKNFSFLTRQEVEQLDKKLGYSYSPKTEEKSTKRGLYTEDVFDRIGEELNDPINFEKYILKGKKDVKLEEVLKYKLEFFFENMHKFSTYNGDMRYLENIRYYFHTLKRFFTPNEAKRVNLYACVVNNDLSNIYSIIKLKTKIEENEQNTYYFYDKKEQRYKEVEKEKLKAFVDKSKDFRIIGEIDQINYLDKEELEL